MDIVLIVCALLIGFYMLWNIGANDVANAIGTSVGSGALTLKRAIIIAGLLEFSGAFILGSNVSETIQHGLINPHTFVHDPMLFVLGMLAALMATAVWLQIATFFRWPVSTTHAIIGAVIGFGAVVGGFQSVQWREVGTIALSWVISPTLSGVFAYFFFAFVQKKILYSFHPMMAAKRISPFLVWLVLFIFMMTTLANGIKNIHLDLTLPETIATSAIVGLIGGIICHIYCSRISQDAKMNPQIAARQEQLIYSLGKSQRSLIKAKMASPLENHGEFQNALAIIDNLIHKAKDKSKWKSHLTSDYRGVERIFGALQILTACFVAFAHGANDVANAIGPVSAVLQVIKDPVFLTATTTRIPYWLLLFGGLGIVFGLATYGWRVIETIGKKISELTPTRGFCAEFAAATTIIAASKLGLPISTTHAIVGAVLGVGIARGLSALNFKLIRDIFLSWIITLPFSAITSILLFYIFQLIFT